MRSSCHRTVSTSQVHDRAAGVVAQHLKLEDHGRKCTAPMLLTILLYAASRVTSLFDACGRLRDAPTDEAVRRALIATLPEMRELERRLNRSLAVGLPKSLTRKRRPMAIDLTEIPYHGKPFQNAREVRRGKAKSGTTHFHAYATLYVARKGRRFTVALTSVFKGDALRDVVKRLLKQAAQAGAGPRYLLLDREFYNIDVIRYLQHSRTPFLMPVAHRGRKPKDPKRAKGTRRFLAWTKSGYGEHRLRSGGRTALVRICVSCKNYAGSWKRRGRQTLVYAYGGFQPRSPRWIRQEYRKRFGVETSYRQMNQARIFTTTRNPQLRLLFVGLALILRNVWVWFHLNLFGRPLPGGGVELHFEALRFRTLLLYLEHFAEDLLGRAESPPPHAQVSQGFTTIPNL